MYDNFPKYQSHKVVRAAQIISVEPGNQENVDARLVTVAVGDERPAMLIAEQTFLRYEAKKGDYMVVYADGYVSFSPQAAFEEGYDLLEDEPVAEATTTKKKGK